MLRTYAADVGIFFMLILVLLCLGGLKYEKSVIPGHHNNGYAYPIRLSGHWYSYEDIEKCIDMPQGSGCNIVYDSAAVPFEEISPALEVAVLFGLSALLLTFHSYGAAQYIASRPEFDKIIHSASPSRYSSWGREAFSAPIFYYFVIESGLGLIFAAGMESAVVYFIKEKVSAPRPFYLTVEKWYSIYPSERLPYFDQASRSFPSGHSGSAAAVCGYFIILLMHGSKSWCQASQYSQQLSGVLCWVLLIFVFYVGATRVKDYWHFTGDVVVGYIIGFCCAWLAFSHVRQYKYMQLLNVIKVEFRRSWITENISDNYRQIGLTQTGKGGIEICDVEPILRV